MMMMMMMTPGGTFFTCCESIELICAQVVLVMLVVTNRKNSRGGGKLRWLHSAAFCVARGRETKTTPHFHYRQCRGWASRAARARTMRRARQSRLCLFPQATGAPACFFNGAAAAAFARPL